MRGKSIVVLCLLTMATLLSAPEARAQAIIEGKIVGAGSEGVAHAQVELLRADGSEARRTESDMQGAFLLAGVEPGGYILKVTSAGFFEAEYAISLSPRQALILTVEMVPRTAARTRIEVHSSLEDVESGRTGTSRFLTREALEVLPAPQTRDLPSLALHLFPGATLSHDNFIHVRGNEVSLHEFVNGVGFLDNPQQEFGPGASPLMFENVNLITGWFPAEFGNRFGGVLDSTARSGFDLKNHGSVDLGLGSFQNHDLNLDYGGTARRFGYYFFANGFTSDWYLNPPERRQVHDFGSGLRGAAQFDYRAGRDTLKLLLFGGGTNFELPNLAEDQQAGRDSARRVRAQTAILGWQHIISPPALLQTSVYERTVSDRLVPTTDPDTQLGDGARSDLTVGWKSDFSYVRRRHFFKTGFDVTRLRLLESFHFDSREPNKGQPDFLEPFFFRGGRSGLETSVYVQDHFSPVANLNLDLGLRYDHFDLIDTRVQVSPRVGVSYRIAKTNSVLHAAYDRFFSPYPLEYALLASFLGTTAEDPDQRVGVVKPYRQHYYEVGWSQRLHPKVFLEIDAFRHTGDTPFEYREIGATRLFLPINSATARSSGADFSIVLKQLERFGLSARFQYSLQRTFFFGPISGGFANGEDKAPGQRFLPAFDETHSGTASLVYANAWRGFWTGMHFRYGSGTPDEEGVRVPGHLTADFSAGLILLRQDRGHVALEFDATNLSDDRYRITKESEETPIQFASPRTISGRLKWRF